MNAPRRSGVLRTWRTQEDVAGHACAPWVDRQVGLSTLAGEQERQVGIDFKGRWVLGTACLETNAPSRCRTWPNDLGREVAQTDARVAFAGIGNAPAAERGPPAVSARFAEHKASEPASSSD